jgi:exodeoxyribonuclease-3
MHAHSCQCAAYDGQSILAPCAPDAVQHEVVHRWSGAVATAELAAAPVLQRITPLRFVLRCARGTRDTSVRVNRQAVSVSPEPRMKIATFNVNNINKRLENLLDWLRTAAPDVVCLQELKAADAELPRAAIAKAGYGAAWRGQRSWNGVAILARGCEPVVTRTALPGDPTDSESRYLEAAVGGVLIASLYAPNGNPQPGPKFAYKLSWMERLAAHAAELWAADVPVVLAGDYNVVPTERDIYPTSSYARNALLQPQSRALFQRLIDQGWIDALRHRHPDAVIYTFWDYLRSRWQRDAGLRIDHLLLSRKAARRLLDAGVDRDVRGRNGASDHAPAWVVLAEDRRMRAPPRGRLAGARQAGQIRAEHEQDLPRVAPGAGIAAAPVPATRRAAGRGAGAAAAPRAVSAATPPPAAAGSRRPLMVIDGDSFAHRAYHALPKTIRRRDGRPAGAILGFANMLLRLHRTEAPRAVVVAWDTLEVPTYRHACYPAYQSGREFDEALLEQLAELPGFVAACGLANAKAPGYEADDLLAAAVSAEERRRGTVLVASGDRDAFQLASARTTILFPQRGGETARIGPDEVRARYGVDPAQVPDLIALRGDPSDRLPGMPGLGPAGAAAVLRRYGTLEKALAAGRFPAHGARLRLFRSIAAMDRTAPRPPLTSQRPTWRKAAALAREWELLQLASRLEALADAQESDRPTRRPRVTAAGSRRSRSSSWRARSR